MELSLDAKTASHSHLSADPLQDARRSAAKVKALPVTLFPNPKAPPLNFQNASNINLSTRRDAFDFFEAYRLVMRLSNGHLQQKSHQNNLTAVSKLS